ncbi:hypothetical protein R3I93_001250 [Phoxinus phoxinus]|uniref:C-type lectin domain-containing protein n=1 Tax=Phoxinus phoxinus TaxID=58324 RepID=A0AAN9DPM6_9TELE
MIQKMTTLLFLLGFVSKTSCYFILIQEPKTWTEAQSFCREYHLDLATVQSGQDRSEIQEIPSSLSWIGLHDGLCAWRWSFQDQDLVFQNWGLSEDTTTRTQRKCGVIRNEGTWHTASCDEQKYFFCYNVTGNKFVFYKTKLTWREAQRYCRMNYVDLAIINDITVNRYIEYLLDTYGGYEGWVGLSMNLWLWSDQSDVNWLSVKWSPGEPDNRDGNDKCAFVYENGLIGDGDCFSHLPFFCTKRSQMQLVRVAVRSAGALDESAVMTAVEEKIRQILSEQEMDAGSSVTWRVQADGKIFQRQKINTRNTTTACEERSTAVRLPRDTNQRP